LLPAYISAAAVVLEQPSFNITDSIHKEIQECMLNIQHAGVLGAATMPCALLLPPAGPREFALGIHSCHCFSFGAASLNNFG
jgi:hypothetical protein